MARPPDGLKHVDRVSGPEQARRRARVILETLSGKRTVAEACQELGLCEARFHKLRDQALQGAVDALKPRRVGRPPKPPPADPTRVEQLEQEVDRLNERLRIAELREEIAMTMPHVLIRQKKITALRKSGKRQARSSPSASDGKDR